MTPSATVMGAARRRIASRWVVTRP